MAKLVDATLVNKNTAGQPLRIGVALYTTENLPSSPLQWAIVTDTNDHFESFDRRFYRHSKRNSRGIITPDLADTPRREGWHLTNIVCVGQTNQEPHLLDTFICTSPFLVSKKLGATTSCRVREDCNNNVINEDWVLSALSRLHSRVGGTFSLPFDPLEFPSCMRECAVFLEENSGAEDIPHVFGLSNMRHCSVG